MSAQMQALRVAADPFQRFVRLNAPIAGGISHEKGLAAVLPGAWPTWGQYLALMEAVDAALAGADTSAPLRVVFDQPGDFAALHAAEQWCRDRGISYGSPQRGAPMGLLVGNYAIAKWRNLSPSERAALHGTMVSLSDGNRFGPIVIEMTAEGAGLVRAQGR